jgi:hypothetical protein
VGELEIKVEEVGLLDINAVSDSDKIVSEVLVISELSFIEVEIYVKLSSLKVFIIVKFELTEVGEISVDNKSSSVVISIIGLTGGIFEVLNSKKAGVLPS